MSFPKELITRLYQAVIFAVAVVLSVASAPSVAISACGDFYRVQRGDTLRSIAIRTIGSDRYLPIFRANSDILANPGKIEVGQLLFVPCKSGGPRTRQDALAAAKRTTDARDDLGDRLAASTKSKKVNIVTPARTPPKLPDVIEAKHPIRLLTASGLVPLVDAGLTSGGITTAMMRRILQVAGISNEPYVGFVDDRKSHLPTLMPTGAFDFAYPWPAPDCKSAADAPVTKSMCRDFLFTRPIYEIEIAVMVPAQSAGVVSTATTERICRPRGFPQVDLEAGLPDVTVISEDSAIACADAVVEGRADMISLPVPMLAKLLEHPKHAASMIELINQRTTVPVHAVVWRKREGAQELVATFNTALAKIQTSGEWFSMVSNYLSAYNSTLATR